MFITSSPSSSFAAPSLLFQRQKSATPFTTTPILRENSSKKNSRRISSSSPNMNPFEFTTASRTVFEIDAFETRAVKLITDLAKQENATIDSDAHPGKVLIVCGESERFSAPLKKKLNMVRYSSYFFNIFDVCCNDVFIIYLTHRKTTRIIWPINPSDRDGF